MSKMNRMSRAWVLLFLAACGGAPEPRDVEVVPHTAPSDLLWSAESEGLYGTLPSGEFLFGQDGDLLCADGLTGEIRWRADADLLGLQAGSCRDTILILQGNELRALREGREIARRGGVAKGSVLHTTSSRAYVFAPEVVAAFDPATLEMAWRWEATDGLRFEGLLASDDRIAIGYITESQGLHETALLRFENGQIRYRFLGHAIGWHGNRFHVYRDRTREVWVWNDDTGEYLESRRLDGRVLGLLEGKLLYSVINRYFSEPAFRVTTEGGGPAPQEIRTVREVQLESMWRQPLEGTGRLQGLLFTDTTARGVVVRWAWDGAPLFEVKTRAGVDRVEVGRRAIAIRTNDGRIEVYRLR